MHQFLQKKGHAYILAHSQLCLTYPDNKEKAKVLGACCRNPNKATEANVITYAKHTIITFKYFMI